MKYQSFSNHRFELANAKFVPSFRRPFDAENKNHLLGEYHFTLIFTRVVSCIKLYKGALTKHYQSQQFKPVFVQLSQSVRVTAFRIVLMPGTIR